MPAPLPDIVLHLGAHRTATTALQQGLHKNRAALSRAGIGYWGPAALRHGRCPRLYKAFGTEALLPAELHLLAEIAADNRDIMQKRLRSQWGMGHHRMIISDENLLGDMGINLSHSSLYGSAKNRLALVAAVLGAQTVSVALGIRPYESYWRSVVGFCGENSALPQSQARLVSQPRRWRDLVLEIRQAFPAASVMVFAFEDWAGHAAAQISVLTEGAVRPAALPAEKINASHGVLPFTPAQTEQMAQDYAADLAWLAQDAPSGVRLVRP